MSVVGFSQELSPSLSTPFFLSLYFLGILSIAFVTSSFAGRLRKGILWIKKVWYICTMEYYSAIKRNPFDSGLIRWINLEPIIQSERRQKRKDQYHILMHMY